MEGPNWVQLLVRKWMPAASWAPLLSSPKRLDQLPILAAFKGSEGRNCSPTRLLSPWDSLGKNTGVGCHVLLQGIFPTRGLNSLTSPPLPGGFFTTSTTWKTHWILGSGTHTVSLLPHSVSQKNLCQPRF